jgi:hypothetical protein
MREPLRLKRPPSKEKHARLREIQRDFHVRAFGEELARVNLDMTIEERLSYLDWMRELAQKHGVPRERSAFRLEERGMDEVEEPSTRHHNTDKLQASSSK